jgi:hypothetical protein
MTDAIALVIAIVGPDSEASDGSSNKLTRN